MLRASPTVFRSPCATPIRLDPPLRYRQSESPVNAAPNAPSVPSTSEASAACLMGLFPVAASTPSKISAAVHAPTGTSVRTGCSGASNQTPSSTLRVVVPPASTASCTLGWTSSAILSSIGNAPTTRCMSVCAICPASLSRSAPIPEPVSHHSDQVIATRLPHRRPAARSARRPKGSSCLPEAERASGRGGCRGRASAPATPPQSAAGSRAGATAPG